MSVGEGALSHILDIREEVRLVREVGRPQSDQGPDGLQRAAKLEVSSRGSNNRGSNNRGSNNRSSNNEPSAEGSFCGVLF